MCIYINCNKIIAFSRNNVHVTRVNCNEMTILELNRRSSRANSSEIWFRDIYRSANGLRMYTLLMSTWLSVIKPYVYEKLVQSVHTVRKDDVARYVRLRDSISFISRESPLDKSNICVRIANKDNTRSARFLILFTRYS